MSRILITSALPYINGVKHLGNLAGSMLPADVYARFQRARGRETLYVCATDEHGTPAELAAAAAGQDVRTYCDEQHQVQADIAARFGLSWDVFGRSSSPQNRALTQGFAKTLWENGYIEERVTQQVYSLADKRFLPDRYVVGTCPHCGYEAARGDQCENCTRVLDPAELIHPRSALSGSPDIEIRDSKHLFLRQSVFAPRLREWIDGKKGQWPNLVTAIAYKWLDEGLQDRGITRDLAWGVPVNAETWGANPDGLKPDVEGLAGKVFYVWFDAPIEYIAATAELAEANGPNSEEGGDEAWERWWRAPGAADVKYVEFMGKDNVPFHTVGFPCTLFGVNETADQPWKLVDELKGFNWLNYYGGKFSTSQKRGVFMDTALEILPADYWRWWLTANAPEGSDASFTWEQFQTQVNADLADVLGNFVNRIVKFTESRFEGMVPEGATPGIREGQLATDVEAKLKELTELLEANELRKAAQAVRQLWVLGNQYLAEAAPWTVFKVDPEMAGMIVRQGLSLVALFARVSHPFIPFGKIEDTQVAEWVERFGGAETA
jgi:methionyl-tRNA synthetase